MCKIGDHMCEDGVGGGGAHYTADCGHSLRCSSSPHLFSEPWVVTEALLFDIPPACCLHVSFDRLLVAHLPPCQLGMWSWHTKVEPRAHAERIGAIVLEVFELLALTCIGLAHPSGQRHAAHTRPSNAAITVTWYARLRAADVHLISALLLIYKIEYQCIVTVNIS